MLKNVSLSNFKCFPELTLGCSRLNLLCGVNGTGKSSVIQSLLVLRQSYETGDLTDGRLLLAGPSIDLGTGEDVIHDGAQVDFVRFVLLSSEVEHPFDMTFGYDRTANEFSRSRVQSGMDYNELSEWITVQPFSGLVHSVTAERLGPRKSYLRSERHARTNDLGQSSQFALNYLLANDNQPMSQTDPRCEAAVGMPTVNVVLDTWLQVISPGAHINIDGDSAAAADAIIAGYTFDQTGDVPTRPFRPTNVGFGLSYTLPVILALLSEPGTLCLIENPEAHLHPRGQTKLGELAARAAKAGVQIFVETHSDHFMDGVRIAVRDGIIEPEEVTFNYFEREGNTATVTTPKIDKDGRLSKWPEGFFDQADENLARLLVRKG